MYIFDNSLHNDDFELVNVTSYEWELVCLTLILWVEYEWCLPMPMAVGNMEMKCNCFMTLDGEHLGRLLQVAWVSWGWLVGVVMVVPLLDFQPSSVDPSWIRNLLYPFNPSYIAKWVSSFRIFFFCLQWYLMPLPILKIRTGQFTTNIWEHQV